MILPISTNISLFVVGTLNTNPFRHQYQPVIMGNKTWRNLIESKGVYIYLVLAIINIFTIFRLWIFEDNIIRLIYSAIVNISILLIFLSMQDRQMLIKCIRTFDMLYLFSQVVLHVVITIMYIKYQGTEFLLYSVNQIFTALISLLCITLHDTTQNFPISFFANITMLFYYIFFRFTYLAQEPFNEHSICIWYYSCTDAVSIIKNLYSTRIIYQVRFIICQLVYRNQTIMTVYPCTIRKHLNHLLSTNKNSRRMNIVNTIDKTDIIKTNSPYKLDDSKKIIGSLDPEPIRHIYQPIIYGNISLRNFIENSKRRFSVVVLFFCTIGSLAFMDIGIFQDFTIKIIALISVNVILLFLLLLCIDKCMFLKCIRQFDFLYLMTQFLFGCILDNLYYDRDEQTVIIKVLAFINSILLFINFSLIITLQDTFSFKNRIVTLTSILCVIIFKFLDFIIFKDANYKNELICIQLYHCTIPANIIVMLKKTELVLSFRLLLLQLISPQKTNIIKFNTNISYENA